MAEKYLPIDQILQILKETPPRLAKLTAGLTPVQLHKVPSLDDWSVNEVLAHLRACDDVWGSLYIMTIITQDNPTIKAVNPRTWIKSTDYLEQEYQTSLDAFANQRARLIAVLELQLAESWARQNRLIGAGKPLQQTMLSHADRLARHERSHIKQIEQIISTLQDFS